MDFTAFVNLVSPARLAALGVMMAVIVVLGVLSALKSHSFKWGLMVSFLEPGFNSFYAIVGYVALCLISTLVDEAWKPFVIVTYSGIVLYQGLKIKEQLGYLVPWLPVANWKLPLESGT